MNTQMRVQVLRYIGVALFIGILTSACVKSQTLPPEEPIYSVFNFSTKEVSTLKIEYDVPTGYQVYFEVYTQNPEELDENGQVVKKNLEPVDVGFTDQNGFYNQKIELPAVAKTLYIYSPYAGVPRILVAEVNPAGISQAKELIAVDSKASSFLMKTKAADDYKTEPYNTITGGNIQRLGYWKNDTGYLIGGRPYRLYGRPDYVLSEKITVSADILKLINQTLPEGGKVDPKLIKNGDVHVTELANVDIHLIDEQTSANSTLAYYCYATHTTPTQAEILNNIVIAFPNSKVLKNHTHSPAGNNGAMERGEGIRLHYWKDGKDLGDEFPAGVSIGWVIYNESYANCITGENPLNLSENYFFANATLNENKQSHAALFKSGDKVIFGLEDWPGDYDYNDVVFYVKSNPVEAITPEVPEVEPEVPDDNVVAATATYRGILSFEDIWPYRGDFDMNDVVIRYESEVGYNKKNEVVQTKDKYTVLSSGAEIDNSFAYQLDVRRSEVEIEITSSLGGNGGAYLDQNLDKATVRLANKLLSYANNSIPETFEVVTKYTGRKIAKEDFTRPPYNPFITTTSPEIEVHLTNMRPTEKLPKDLLGFGHDRSDPGKNLYYITYDEAAGVQMPFAIDVAFGNNEDMDAFVIPKERARIDVHYPKFINWVKSAGKENQDWYLHPKP